MSEEVEQPGASATHFTNTMANTCVIGLGRSGIAAAKLLNRNGWNVTLSDRADSPNLRQLQQQLAQDGITVKLAHSFAPTSSEVLDLVVVSPGVPWDLPALVDARNQGIQTIGEMELAWQNLNHIPWVGITGSNGKTTTTALTAAIFQAAGLNAPACGNIGYAACELALGGDRLDWIVAELSSYQIESSCDLAPQIGIWTTFSADHLNRHYTLENYYNIKASLLQRCPQQIFNGDDPYLRSRGLEQRPEAVWASVRGKERLLCPPAKGVYLDESGWVVAFEERICPAASLKMVGAHNQQNLLLAIAAARLAGIEKSAIARAVETFPGVAHRLEYLCTYQGADFINDSKATNYDAAQVGLAAVQAPAILIAGGQIKAGDDTTWLQAVKTKAANVLLIGEAAPIFARRLKEVGYSAYEIVETLESAVSRSAELTQQQDISVVLLSPACASFDQYPNFEHRGEHFRELCLQLSGGSREQAIGNRRS